MIEQDRGRSALILYGTETGTSQDLAEEVGRTLERLHFLTDVSGLDEINYTQLRDYTFTIFVVATTGQGDFPENARKFWTSLLRKKLGPATLSGVDFAVVGLGDSSYIKFNFAARKLEKRLRQLGASQIVEPCEADEQGDEGTDGAFLAWLQYFRESILKIFPLGENQKPIPNDVMLPSKSRLETISEGTSFDGPSSVNGFHLATSDARENAADSFPVTLVENRRVTPASHWQDVRFLRLRASKRVDYFPGDAIAISPRNMPIDVESLMKRMNWQDLADTRIRLASTRRSPDTISAHYSTNNPFSNRADLTLRILLTEYLDINAIPRRSFFGCIANYTDDSMHKERLLEFTDPQYLDEYYDYATRPRRSILEILQEFDSVQLPWQEATNIFPLMRPRQFSIASGGHLKKHDNDEDGAAEFELLVAIVKYRTVIKRIREGVCTKYLAQLLVGTEMHVTLKTEGRFFKPSDPAATRSHLLIGAGTGIAPLRALIHEKYMQSPSQQLFECGRTVLFFGCRNASSDYFFHDEWNTMTRTNGQGSGALEIIPAFSRDQKTKVYVQDRIRERSALVWEFLRERRATVIVCGSSGQMPKAVRQALVDALVEQGVKRRDETKSISDGDMHGEVEDEDEVSITTPEDAEAYLTSLEKEGRFKQETWS